MNREKKYFRRSVGLTVAVYIAVILLFFVSFRVTRLSQLSSVPHTQPRIVQAVAVNQRAVEKNISQIKAREKAKHDAEIARQRHLANLAHRAQQQRLAEQKRLVQMKKQQQLLEQKRKAQEIVTQKKLVQMKRQQQAEQQKLQQLQKQRQTVLAKQAVEKKAAVKKKQLTQAQKQLEQQIAAEQKKLSDANQRILLGEVNKYKSKILNAIGQQWIMPTNTNKKLSTEFLIALMPGGTVLSVKIIKSSGSPVLDRSVISAIWKASPLPVPKKTDIFNEFRQLHLTVRPEGLMG